MSIDLLTQVNKKVVSIASRIELLFRQLKLLFYFSFIPVKQPICNLLRLMIFYFGKPQRHHNLSKQRLVEISRVGDTRKRQYQKERCILPIWPGFHELCDSPEHFSAALWCWDKVENQRARNQIKLFVLAVRKRSLHEILLQNLRVLRVQVYSSDRTKKSAGQNCISWGKTTNFQRSGSFPAHLLI